MVCGKIFCMDYENCCKIENITNLIISAPEVFLFYRFIFGSDLMKK